MTMNFQPWLRAQAAEYQSLSSVPAAMEKMSPHPVLTPTPPLSGRSVRQLRDLAWGGRRGGGREAAAREETARFKDALDRLGEGESKAGEKGAVQGARKEGAHEGDQHKTGTHRRG